MANARKILIVDDDYELSDGIRAVLPDRLVEGTYGLKRLDVLASVRDKPQAE